MSTKEQQELKRKAYAEAMRYLDNAKEQLKKAGKSDFMYTDAKYVRAASGIAYSGVLVALKAYAMLKDIKPRKGEKYGIEFFQREITKIDKKLLNLINSAYYILHLSGYYDGSLDSVVIKRGFDQAKEILAKIKPAA